MKREDVEMKCQQLFALLSEFIDGQLPEDICRQMEAHLADCQPCHVFLRTLQATVETCRRLPSSPLPEETRRELRELLRAELAEWRRH